MRSNRIGQWFAVAVALLFSASAARADLMDINKDFEALDAASPGALAGDGWKIFANVFAADGQTFLYNYGVFDAPNGSGGFSNVAVGEGGAAQGEQQLVVFNDYNNGDHTNGSGNRIEAIVFQELTVGAVDVGETYIFSFDAKRGDIGGATTANAFIKTLDPNNGFQTTNFITVDTTDLLDTWSRFEIELLIDEGLVGQIFQIGFSNTASNEDPSGVFYDNILLEADVSDAANDLNADGKSDITWRNMSSGMNWLYQMDGATVSVSAPINTVSDQNWMVVGTGDANDDGKADLLWRNMSSGLNWLYLMSGSSISQSIQLGTVSDLNWQIVGNGDYNGDGFADILWRNTLTGENWIYLMNSGAVISSARINTVVDQNWVVQGSADHNGDGNDDILWRNQLTGENRAYVMNGTTIVASVKINTVSDLDWQIAGVGDANGDGQADILWRNADSGLNWLYLIEGGAIVSSIQLGTVSDQNWQIVGNGDYNGDGKADILWRNSATGENWVYFMDSGTRIAAVRVNTVSDQNWKVLNEK